MRARSPDAWVAGFGPAAGHVLGQVLDGTGPDDEVVALVHALARRLRMATDRDPADPRLVEVRAGLRGEAPALAALWDCRGVGAFGRPAVRLAGVRRTARLLGEAGALEPTGATVLVLLREGPTRP